MGNHNKIEFVQLISAQTFHIASKAIPTLLLTLICILHGPNAFSISGTGTSGDPYLVATASDLATIQGNSAYWASGVYIKQTADIDLSVYADWTPIAPQTTSPFYGDYNGNGYKISNLTITTTHNGYLGLFGVIGSSGAGSVHDLGIINGSITAGTYVGMLVGRCAGTITNCYSTGTISCSTSLYIGGIVGLTYIGCTVSSSYSTVNCSSSYTSTSSCVGGLTGGITGNASYSSTIQNCYSTGSSTQSSTGYAGGFIGLVANSYVNITNCYSTGALSGTNIGGFAGKYTAGTISNCYFDYETAGTSTICPLGSPAGITVATTSTMKTPSTFTTAGWNSSTWTFISNTYPRLTWAIPASSTFSGNGNWSTSANWSNGVPGSTTNAIIDGNCIANADYPCANLTINSGKVLTIDPDNCLTVSGTLTNNAGVSGLVLSSTSAGNGTLLNNTAGVNATVKQFLTKNKWHYLGIPVTYIPDVADVLYNVYVLHMDESNAYSGLESGWQYLSTGDSLLHLKGYAVQYNRPGNNDTTISFTGELNTGTIDTIFDSETEGWNLISNPYPCGFNWDAPGAKTLYNCNDAIYIWQSDNNQYGSYGTYVSGGSTNGQTQYISSNQGFYVQVWYVNSGISLTNSGKVNSEVSFASIDELPMNKKGEWLEGSMPNKHLATKSILIGITDDGVHYDEALIRTSPFARVDFDSELDAAKLVALESKTPQIYTLSEGREFSINTLESLNKESLIPINVLVKSNDKQTITVRSEDGFNENDVVYLYNPKGELLADLSKSDYTFEGSEGLINSYYLAFNRISKERLISYHQAVTSMHSKIKSRTIKPLNGGMFSVQIQKLAQK